MKKLHHKRKRKLVNIALTPEGERWYEALRFSLFKERRTFTSWLHEKLKEAVSKK